MSEIYVVGVGMTPFGRLTEVSLKAMVRQATEAALNDAGLQKDSIEAAFFGNASQGHMEGQQMIRGQIALRDMGISRIPMVNVENACASGSSAFTLAVNHLKAGAGDIALAVGAEKMYSADRSRMFSVFDSALDISCAADVHADLLRMGEGVEVPPGTTSPKPYSVFMDVYAAFARAHMKRFGTTQRQIAAVAAKNHAHSVHNPLSQYRTAYTIDDVLAAAPITYPLTVPMCSPVSDGAAAAILCTGAALRRLGLDTHRAVRVLSSVIQTGSDRNYTDVRNHLTVHAARRAYEAAGVGPRDVSVAEVHDATAMGEIIQIENLGFFEFGEGGPASERGDTSIGGRIPVNPSGGLESKGHPVGATGIAQAHELVTQLRGEAGPRQVDGASIAVAENGGGLYGVEEAVACVTILGR
ncbi:MAG: Thiolase [uncultured Paraburkholderia sp.]|uniref:thiolase family protein n=1 Tax=uncultured Paraburkholderia sp. TaxID=1822466 RepID=UPI002591C6D1|nr:thiolase family protein [uncultured Paraburkholderia sp.]CAH2894075.1 MAG: Thiolase [uncultured Paraburkholderia sp.]CAH2912102.1 MAG: Thiolase [uncultured Paraburkholderia sp.]